MLRFCLLSLLIAPLLVLPLSGRAESFSHSVEKITFNLAVISPAGLIGEGTNLQSVSYEFCIPATETHRTEVQAIDPSVQYFPHSRGRIDCSDDQILCIGHTHQARWREILQQLASLDYVERIDRFWGE
ncbi:hypothetical protein [Leptolyngbya sp. 7M]|uniref:hypothetical protein n=1 Tax=Leptolyngbya sp. 7M TaxID=2812896 RepID=UPI001B8B0BDB|nr:hypothetical protein [Leptolyngbya sp. 7M]QYO62858.1 hypothetical protein JVX88_22960 [Leptolyngbya sp. 7M]